MAPAKASGLVFRDDLKQQDAIDTKDAITTVKANVHVEAITTPERDISCIKTTNEAPRAGPKTRPPPG